MRQLPDAKGVLLEEPEYVGPLTLCRLACARFPSVSESLLEERESLHLQMAVLARRVYETIDRADERGALDVFAFLEEILRAPRLESEVEVAVAISFVVPEELRAGRAGARVLEEARRIAPRVVALLRPEALGR